MIQITFLIDSCAVAVITLFHYYILVDVIFDSITTFDGILITIIPLNYAVPQSYAVLINSIYQILSNEDKDVFASAVFLSILNCFVNLLNDI